MVTYNHFYKCSFTEVFLNNFIRHFVLTNSIKQILLCTAKGPGLEGGCKTGDIGERKVSLVVGLVLEHWLPKTTVL